MLVMVQVEEHDALPDGCSLRFKAQEGPFPVVRIAWESDDGLEGIWTASAASADGTLGDARGYVVDDSSAGLSVLVIGGDHGLRLVEEKTQTSVAEPYLLVSRQALRGL